MVWGGSAAVRFVLALLALLLMVLAACQGEASISNPLRVTSVPWPDDEEAQYILQDSGGVELGRGTLRAVRQGDGYRLIQRYQSQEMTDELVAVVGADLKPFTITRVISGEKGELRIEAQYQGGRLSISYTSPKDLKSHETAVSPDVYDNGVALFLWRTIPFTPGYETGYVSVASAIVRKPERVTVAVRVVARETVQVPAGTFQAWRLEIRGGGSRQVAWYDDAPPHHLVKYDNGQQLFLLASVSP